MRSRSGKRLKKRSAESVSEGRRTKRSGKSDFWSTIARRRKRNASVPRRRSSGARKRSGWKKRRKGSGRWNCKSGGRPRLVGPDLLTVQFIKCSVPFFVGTKQEGRIGSSWEE